MNPTNSDATIRALAGAVTAALGDFPRPKFVAVSVRIFARQVEALAAIDPATIAALRALVEARVRPLVPDDEGLERALTCRDDPHHTYWLAVVPLHLVCKWVTDQLNPPGARGFALGPFSIRMPGDDAEGPDA